MAENPEITSGTGDTKENIEAYHISVFLLGVPLETLDGKVVKADKLGSSLTLEICTLEDDTPLYRGVLSAA